MPYIEYEEELYLPDWLVRMRAKERVKFLMERQNPRRPGVIGPGELADMPANKKVRGAYVEPANARFQDPLIIVSQDTMTADEVRDLARLTREGGYGKGPRRRFDKAAKREWIRSVGNLVDWLQQSSLNRKKGRVVIGVH